MGSGLDRISNMSRPLNGIDAINGKSSVNPALLAIQAQQKKVQIIVEPMCRTVWNQSCPCVARLSIHPQTTSGRLRRVTCNTSQESRGYRHVGHRDRFRLHRDAYPLQPQVGVATLLLGILDCSRFCGRLLRTRRPPRIADITMRGTDQLWLQATPS